MEPFRVLIVDNTFTFGGAINVISQMASKLDRWNVVPLVITGQPQEVVEKLFRPGLAVRYGFRVPWSHTTLLDRLRAAFLRWTGKDPLPSRIFHRARGIYWILTRTIPQAISIGRLATEHRADLIHLNNTLEGQGDGLIAAKILGIPCIAHARGQQTGTRGMKVAAGAVDCHVAISTEMRANLLSIGIPGHRIALVPDGIDLDRFSPAPPPPGLRKDLGLSDEGPIVAIFGRLIKWKGIREFILGFERVHKALPSAQGMIVGDPSDGDPGYARDAQELARKLGLEKALHFVGYREDVPDLMRLSDVVVHCSIIPEPFGLVVAEAMATGTPVVAADRGGPKDVIRDGVDGLLVDPRDPEKLGIAILKILQDKQRAAEFAGNGLARVRDRYSMERLAEDMAGLYRLVIDSRRRKVPLELDF